MTQNEKKLLQQFRSLTENQRETLLDFAAFLAAREEVAGATEPVQPIPMERPAQESSGQSHQTPDGNLSNAGAQQAVA